MSEKSKEHKEVPDLEALKKELEEAKKRDEELLTRLKYAQADLENYRKRVDKEMKDAGEALARTLASKLLVVQDELDLAIGHAQGRGDDGQLKEGLQMVSGNLRSALESVGVEKIEAVGMKFDPSIHEAVETVQGEREGDDVVVEEVRPGFTFRGQLLRPSMVKVELGMKPAKEEASVNE